MLSRPNENRPWLLGALCLAVACSGSDDASGPSEGTGGTSVVGAGGSAGVVATGGGAGVPTTGGEVGPLRSYGPGDVIEADITIPGVAPGGEDTVCVRVQLDTAGPVPIVEVRGFIAEGSHHMIIDRSSGTEELVPYPCRDLQGSDASRILIAQQKDTVFTLPERTAFTIDRAQTLTVEMHYINTTNEPLDAHGRVELVVGDAPAEEYTEAAMRFLGNFAFSLPPNQASTVDYFQPLGSAGAPFRLFAATSHTHALGIHAVIERATADGEVIEILHESNDWAEPPLTEFEPALVFDGSDGVHLTCEYENTRDETVNFGTKFEDEMCFMWLYSY